MRGNAIDCLFPEFLQIESMQLRRFGGSILFFSSRKFRINNFKLVFEPSPNLNRCKDIWVKYNFGIGVDFPNGLSIPSKSMCLTKREIIFEVGWGQYYRLRKGRILYLEEVLTIRNVFQHCLLNMSPNGWQPIDHNNGVNTIRVLPFVN